MFNNVYKGNISIYYKFLLLIFILVASYPLNAEESDLSDIATESTDSYDIVLPLGQHYLKTAWDYWYPYEYPKNSELPSSPTGFDIQLLEVLAKKANQELQFIKLDWASTLEALKIGQVDMSTGATFSEERKKFAYFSKPYRYDETALYVSRKREDLYTFDTAEELLSYVSENPFKLGVVKGYVFPNEALNQWILDPQNIKQVIFTKDEQESLRLLVDNDIDGFLSDRIIGSTLIWETNNGQEVSEISLNLKSPIHLIFSQKTVPISVVEKFNEAILSLKEETLYKKLVSWYVYPSLLLQTVDTDWFQSIDFIGTFMFSVSGVLLAHTLRTTLLSAFIFAVLPSLGGSIVRDIIFNQRPVEKLATPIYMAIICITVLFMFFVVKLFDRLKKHKLFAFRKHFLHKISFHYDTLFMLCDGLGLAAFTVTGVLTSVKAKVDPLWLWGPLFAFITGAGGAIARDILSKKGKLEDIEGEIYSEIAIIWGLILSLGLLHSSNVIRPDYIFGLIMFTLIGAFVTRLLIYYLKVPNVYFR